MYLKRGNQMKKLFFILIFTVFNTHLVFADTILLKNGKKVEGQIIKETSENIVIEQKFDFGALKKKIKRSEIEKIVKNNQTTTKAIVYQFEDYVWGTPLSKIKQQLKEKDIDYIQLESNLGYESIVWNSPCQILLGFTPKSNLLSSVSLTWNNTSIGEEIKRKISMQHGNPKPREGIKNVYDWMDDKGNVITLDYNIYSTILIYNNDILYEKGLKEKDI